MRIWVKCPGCKIQWPTEHTEVVPRLTRVTNEPCASAIAVGMWDSWLPDLVPGS